MSFIQKGTETHHVLSTGKAEFSLGTRWIAVLSELVTYTTPSLSEVDFIPHIMSSLKTFKSVACSIFRIVQVCLHQFRNIFIALREPLAPAFCPHGPRHPLL